MQQRKTMGEIIADINSNIEPDDEDKLLVMMCLIVILSGDVKRQGRYLWFLSIVIFILVCFIGYNVAVVLLGLT